METVIIERNKNYFRRIAAIVLIAFILYQLIKFLRNPSEHTYFLLPTKYTVIIFSIMSIIICSLVVILLITSIFRKNVYLKIYEKGIYNGFFLYNKKLITWEEISRIKTIKYNYNNYIAIFLKETSNNEKGISSIIFMINEKSMGTPYIITSSDLDCSFEQLEQLILENYNQRKQRKN